jgi:hypothetical protein
MILHCDKYFTDIGKHYIHQTISFLQHHDFIENDEVIDGAAISGEDKIDMRSYNLYIYHHDSYHMVFLTKKGVSPDIYMFGLYVYNEDGVQHARTFHHSHGPFEKVYGFHYEDY